MTAVLCAANEAKTALPGSVQDICAVCCGTKRLVEIACPPTCIYLKPRSGIRRRREAAAGAGSSLC